MLEPNAFFGKYCIVQLVGRGGMGVVYLAEDTMLGRQVALKILDQGFTADRSFAERFRDEARFIASLEHPHIVGIHALEKVGDIWCIDMPFVRGGSLLDAFAASALTPTQVVRLCGQVLDALSCCHHSGMIHRDIKPANILLTDNSDAMISDFGLAKLLAEEQNALINSGSSSGMFMGTPKYAPPESWDGHQPTPAWDVYAVGMILYEGITGSSPYTAESPLALMKQMVSSSIPPLSEVKAGVSEPLSALVGRMLSGDPEVRPRTGSESLEQLMTGCNGGKPDPAWQAFAAGIPALRGVGATGCPGYAANSAGRIWRDVVMDKTLGGVSSTGGSRINPAGGRMGVCAVECVGCFRLGESRLLREPERRLGACRLWPHASVDDDPAPGNFRAMVRGRLLGSVYG